MLKQKLFMLLLYLCMGFYVCAALMQLNIFPVEKDIELGKQFDGEIRSNSKEYPILKNRPDVKAYITNIGNKTLASPDILYRGQFAYQFEVIDDDKTIHPSSGDRLACINQMIKDIGNPQPSETNIFAKRYHQFKKGLS